MDLLTSIKPNNRSIQADRLVQIDCNFGQYKMEQQTPIPPSHLTASLNGGGGGSNFPSILSKIAASRNADGEEDKSVRCGSPQPSGCLIEMGKIKCTAPKQRIGFSAIKKNCTCYVH